MGLALTIDDWNKFIDMITKHEPGHEPRHFYYRGILYRANQFDELIEKAKWEQYGVIPF